MITKITYYCDPETLGEMDLDAFRTQFQKAARVHYPHASIDVTTDEAAAKLESADDDWDPIDEFEQLDRIAEKAFAATCGN